MAFDMSDVASSSNTAFCMTCNSTPFKYTCPRCSTRTCSAVCSRKHKESTGCTGERDKVKYVPMKEYGWGTMMNDYVFLEEMGRKVGDWGKEIVKGGFDASAAGTSSGSHRGVPPGRSGDRGRGRGGVGVGRHRKPIAFSKKDHLKLQLEARDIYMELLPTGMEKKRLNQSRWNSKNNTAQLTMSFTFHPPAPDPLHSPSSSISRPYTIMTHKNGLSTPLLKLAIQAVNDAFKNKNKTKGAASPPEWLQHYLVPHEDDPDSFKTPLCAMNARADPRGFGQHSSRSRKRTKPPSVFYRFDLDKPLQVLLKHTHFVEYPTLEFFEDGTFNGITVEPESAAVHSSSGNYFEDETADGPKKRQKVTTKAKAAMNGMLGDYGSGGEEDEQEQGAKGTTGLSLLGAYAESDEEGMDERKDDSQVRLDVEEEDEKKMDDILQEMSIVHGFGSDSEDDGERRIDPERLYNFVMQARTLDEGEEEVDWSNSGEEDIEIGDEER